LHPETWTSPALLAPLALCATAVSGLVWSDWTGLRAGRYLCKPLAAAAFLWLALAAGAAGSDYGHWLLAGLALCAVGDLLLMGERDGYFLAGLAAFLCGHLCYVGAFLHLGGDSAGPLLSTLPVLALLLLTLRWLWPLLPQRMKIPVGLYLLVIGAMLLAAALSLGTGAALPVLAGAWGFALSDLAVARRQFVGGDRVSGLWGTPLYFLAQMALAASAALA